MKFVSYSSGSGSRAGLIVGNKMLDYQSAAVVLEHYTSSDMTALLQDWENTLAIAGEILSECSTHPELFALQDIPFPLLSPVPNPPSVRDGYAFRQHVMTARRNRGVEMIPEFDEYPIFYFTNHLSVFGEGEISVEKDHLKNLDFELECAVVIGKTGKNIPSSEADAYIAGFMIFNDWSARVLQMEEMKLNLGPAKGKDFASSFGPYLVTPDELSDCTESTPFGNRYKMRMTAFHNGKQISDGNVADMNWTFAELIERASYGVTLRPGDIIGSGTVGTGCYLELNGTAVLEAKAKGEQFTPVWIQEGDTFELEIERLGRLKNTISLNPSGFSILEKKKKINQ